MRAITCNVWNFARLCKTTRPGHFHLSASCPNSLEVICLTPSTLALASSGAVCLIFSLHVVLCLLPLSLVSFAPLVPQAAVSFAHSMHAQWMKQWPWIQALNALIIFERADETAHRYCEYVLKVQVILREPPIAWRCWRIHLGEHPELITGRTAAPAFAWVPGGVREVDHGSAPIDFVAVHWFAIVVSNFIIHALHDIHASNMCACVQKTRGLDHQNKIIRCHVLSTGKAKLDGENFVPNTYVDHG